MLYGGACSQIATDDACGSNDVQRSRHAQSVIYACSTLSCVRHPARLHKLGHSTRHTLVALAHHYTRLPPQKAPSHVCQKAQAFSVFPPVFLLAYC